VFALCLPAALIYHKLQLNRSLPLISASSPEQDQARKMSRRSGRRIPNSNVPRFTIDLSLPPRDRYKSLTTTYKAQIQNLTPLFNGLLADFGISESYHRSINTVAGLMLRGVHSRTETAELRGISEVSGISMYLLVAFNVVLDLLMGCTSGAVKSMEPGQDSNDARMLHFRTLDWGMDPLRNIVVQLDFIRSKSGEPTAVIASSVTYVGFVGVLTGVRPGFSTSLNFRPLHNAETRGDQFRFYFHHLLVLLGLRPSISSILRSYLFGETPKDQLTSLESISNELPGRHTTAAYLIFSNGQSTMTMEKDYKNAIIRQSSTFIVATNHDRDETVSEPNATTNPGEHAMTVARMAALQDLLDESRDRMDCVAQKWKAQVKRQSRASRTSGSSIDENVISIPGAEVIRWVSAWPTTNETTHFATVMDPKLGQVLWSHAYTEPVAEPAPLLSV
jgi:beta subunit of N-acylethanolamine-hydrolyzing acid amidase